VKRESMAVVVQGLGVYAKNLLRWKKDLEGGREKKKKKRIEKPF